MVSNMKYSYYDFDYKSNNPKELYEASFKELKSLTLPQVSARVKTQNLSVTYLGVDNKGTIHFKCTSGTTPGKFWYQQIKLLDLPDLVRDKKGYKDKEIMNLAVFGNLAVYCNDLSFKYYGWQYLSWVRGYGIHKDIRYPRVKNPYLKGALCKHLYAVFNVFPMYINTFVRDFRKVGLL